MIVAYSCRSKKLTFKYTQFNNFYDFINKI